MSTILAVDDSLTMRKCLEITFAGTEFNLVAVDTAQAALEKVKTLSPDLVIADVSLPPNDGYELCSTIKLAAPDLPVLMLSSKQNPFDPSKGSQADDHIDKPFDTQVMQDRARGLCKPSEKSDTAPPVAAAQPPPVERPMQKRQPERAPASSKIPAPRRKRPTPAMMTNPLKEQSAPKGVGGVGSPAAAMRRTVPFAMPGSAKAGVAAKAGGAAAKPAGVVTPGGVVPGGGLAGGLAGGGLAGGGPAVGPAAGGPAAGGLAGGGVAGGMGALGGGASVRRDPPIEVKKAPSVDRTMQMGSAERAASEALGKAVAPADKVKGDTLPGVPKDGSNGGFAQLPADKAADLQTKLNNLGLNKQQVEGVLSLSREIIEQVVWDVVPTLAETLIKEEIARLTKE